MCILGLESLLFEDICFVHASCSNPFLSIDALEDLRTCNLANVISNRLSSFTTFWGKKKLVETTKANFYFETFSLNLSIVKDLIF